MISYYCKTFTILYFAAQLVLAMYSVGKPFDHGVFPWFLPLQVGSFLLLGMIPAYFAGKHESK